MTQLTRPAITFAVLMTATQTLAQSADEPDDLHSPSYEVGFGIAPWFLAYIDVEATQPPSVWATLPVGRFRLQMDYLRSVRGEPLWYAGYHDTDDQGRDVRFEVARTSHHVEQLFGAAVQLPFRRLGRRGYLLVGGAWMDYTDRWCVARQTGESADHGARLDFPAGFECSSSPADVSHNGLVPLYGVGWDVPLGSSFFGSLQYRARLLPQLGELRVGAGFRF